MPPTFQSRAETLRAHPLLAEVVLSVQAAFDPRLEPFRPGDRAWLDPSHAEATTLDELASARLNAEGAAAFDAIRDPVERPAIDRRPFGEMVLAADGASIDAVMAGTGEALALLGLELDWGPVTFITTFAAPWLGQDNDHPPARAARDRLAAWGVGPDYAGAIAAEGDDLAALARELMAIARYNAAIPDIRFAGLRADCVGSLCSHANLHFDVASAASGSRLVGAAVAAGLRLEHKGCRERFAGDAVEGRRIDL